jgi:hypothetical protein
LTDYKSNGCCNSIQLSLYTYDSPGWWIDSQLAPVSYLLLKNNQVSYKQSPSLLDGFMNIRKSRGFPMVLN